MEDALQALMNALYGRDHQQPRMAIADLRLLTPGVNENDFDNAIGMLAQQGLVGINLTRDTVILAAPGKTAFEKGYISEICLGNHYLVEKYRRSIVHISVRDQDGDAGGGAGFFVADFPGWIATAGHVVDNNHAIVDIRDENDAVISDRGFQVRRVGEVAVDLALIRCDMPNGVNPLKIEWERNATRELDSILVAGYPYIAQYNPALVFSQGVVATYATRQGSDRKSMIISRITEPGFSGGPVVNQKGLVVGVVEQENILTDKQGNRSILSARRLRITFHKFLMNERQLLIWGSN